MFRSGLILCQRFSIIYETSIKRASFSNSLDSFSNESIFLKCSHIFKFSRQIFHEGILPQKEKKRTLIVSRKIIFEKMESKINCYNNCYINIISKIEVICRRKREIRLIVFKLQLILRDIKSSRIFQRRRKRYPTTFPFFFFSFMPVLRIIRQNDVEEKKYTKIIEDGQSAVSCLTQTVAELPLII